MFRARTPYSYEADNAHESYEIYYGPIDSSPPSPSPSQRTSVRSEPAAHEFIPSQESSRSQQSMTPTAVSISSHQLLQVESSATMEVAEIIGSETGSEIIAEDVAELYLPSPKETESIAQFGTNAPVPSAPGAFFSTRTPVLYADYIRNHTVPSSPSSPSVRYATPSPTLVQRVPSPTLKQRGQSPTLVQLVQIPTPAQPVQSPGPLNPSTSQSFMTHLASNSGSKIPVFANHNDPSNSENVVDDTDENANLSADSNYAKRRRRLLDILNRLHRTGVQQDVDLPQIAVIGSQSVGKSSLIESISGVALPRDTGTCTRCPLECRLEYSPDTWSCRISIRMERDKSGNPLDEVKEYQFGPVITVKSAVEPTLRRAQRAILRPTLDYNLFLRDNDLGIPDPPPQSFSYNCVCLHIEGPDVPDLYFYDLPGLIANVKDDGDVKDIELVHNLARTYVSKPSCVVLLAISCETDFENQGAGSLVREVDPEGERVVGVLTKPDRIENATTEKWSSVLQNKENRFLHGWFCVKQPNPTELKQKITWEDARERERTFFATQEPWRSLPGQFRRRLGSPNLIFYLSRLLSDLVDKRAPEIERELGKLLDDVNKRLKLLPAPNFEDPSSDLVRLILLLTSDVSRTVMGTTWPEDPMPGLFRDIRLAQKELRASIVRTAPRFCPWEKRDTPSSSALHAIDPQKLPTAWVAEPAFLFEEDKALFVNRVGKILFLDEVMELAENAIGRELPQEYPFSVKKDLIRMFLSEWRKPMLDYFEVVHTLMTQRMKALVDLHFGKYTHTGLRDKVKSIVGDELQILHGQTLERLNSLLSVEDLPFTLNHMSFKEYKVKFFAHYQDIRRCSKRQDAIIQQFQSGFERGTFSEVRESNAEIIMRLLRGYGFTTTRFDISRLLPTDELEPALWIMATVRAYFQEALVRFIDVVPLEVDEELVQGFEKVIRNALIVGLDIKSPQRCAKWLAEAKETVDERKELMATKQRLAAARGELLSFLNGS